MGCATSKLDASDVLLQCKERRKAIKEAVSCRQDFAVAHVAYIQTLRNVGLALRRFSEGEVSDTSPTSPTSPVLRLAEASHASTPVAALSPPQSPPHSPSSPSPSPSPPASHAPEVINAPARMATKAVSPSSPPLPASISPPVSSRASRASRFSHSSPPPLTEASSPTSEMVDAPQRYSINGMGLGSPDRASDLSPPFYSPRRDDADDYFMSYSPSHALHSPTHMTSPARNSSSWFVYDIFDAPPIPYNLLEHRRRKRVGELEDDDDYPAPDVEHVPKEDWIPDLEEEELKEEEARSVKSVEKGKEVKEKASTVNEEKKADVTEQTNDTSEKKAEAMEEKENSAVEQIPIVRSPEKEVTVEVETRASPRKELAVITSGQGRDLTGAVKHIHTQFARACRSGKDVSGMLETQMVYHHMGFLDSKDSSKGFNAITWHWSRKSSLAMRDAYEDHDAPECSMMFGSHASSLERLYAWEKKLYDEVKAGEVIRIAFDRKCHQLHSLDAKGGDPIAIDKTRAALKKLDTQLIVALRAMHLASVKIQNLTNDELFPQLAELLGGLMRMWQVMLECHKAQAAIAAEMESLENSVAGKEASEAHIKATSQLEAELEKWQTHFKGWIDSQQNYIAALHAWLSKCHMEPERDSSGRSVSPHWKGKPAIFHLLSNWKDALLKLEQRQQAVEAILNFSVVVHSLEIEQAGELDLKKNAEKSARELDYTSRSLQRLESRYIEYKKEESKADHDPRHSSVQMKRADLDSRRTMVESEKRRHTEVMLDRKEKTLSRFREHLPAVFESMASFAKEALKTYEKLQLDKPPARGNGVSHHFSED